MTENLDRVTLEAVLREKEALEAQVRQLMEQLDDAERKASRALASYQQYALTMEIVRQQNEELDALSSDLSEASRLMEERARQLEIKNDQLRESEEENLVLIEKLKVVVRQLSTPILQVWKGVLALPIIGVVDEERASQIMERALEAVVQTRARCVIIDVTGVDTIDPSTASHFLSVAQGVKMLGARCILSGVRPGVAQAMVTMGLDMGTIDSARNLHSALETTLRAPSLA